MPIPPPRPAVADPALTRPDWTAGAARSNGALCLDKNENTDPAIVALVAGLLGDIPAAAAVGYPDAAPVYGKLAAHLGCDARNLLFTAGSDGAIRLTFEAFVSPGDTVVLTRPSFAMYDVYALAFGARTIHVDHQPSDTGPQAPLTALLETIARERPRLICLPNPDSPTGTALSPGDMERVIMAAGDAGSVILVDEAYYPFHPETCLPWIGRFPHLVVTRTFAKAWGLAGARIGFAAAHPDMAAILHKMRPMYEVNGLGLALAGRMLDHQDAVTAAVARLNDGRDWFSARMGALGLRTAPSAGNFMHVAFAGHAPAVHQALADIVLYRHNFDHPSLAGFSRFSAAPRPLLEPIADRIAAVVSPLCRTPHHD